MSKDLLERDKKMLEDLQERLRREHKKQQDFIGMQIDEINQLLENE